MAANLEKLIAQRDELDRQIAEMQAAQRAEVVAQIREQMAVYGIDAMDIAGRKRAMRSDKGVPRGPRAAAKKKKKV